MKHKKYLFTTFFLILFVLQQTQAFAKISPDINGLFSNQSLQASGLPDKVLVYMYQFTEGGDPTSDRCRDQDTTLGCVESFSNLTYPPDTQYVTFPYGGVNPILVDVENYYLKNVLPREMNVAENYPTLAALQAQALAARSIADWKTRLGQEFTNTTFKQVFVPGSYEKYLNPDNPVIIQNRISDAITLTNGQYLSYNGNGESIDAEFGSDFANHSTTEGQQPYLIQMEEPISTTCDTVSGIYSGWGMSQKGAIRWSLGNQCAAGGDDSTKWSVKWTDYRQILVHYYMGIDILDGNGGKIAPDDRWNLLWHDVPFNAQTNPNIPIVFQVQLQNTSTSEWGENDVILGYQWTPKNAPATPGNWTDAAYIPAAGKGEDKTFTASNIMTPSNGGEYTLHLDVRHQNGNWFSNAGWPDATININITGTTATPTLSLSTATPTPTTCTHWDIASDFRISPYHINPNPDSCGNAGVWEFMGSGNPNYQLPTFTSNIGGYTGLDFWFGTHIDGNGSFPAIGFNGSGETRVFGAITFPVNAVNIHPAPVQSGVIAWHSPVSGHVSISGGVSDNDPACGNGILWYIDTETGNLASGGINNGSGQDFASGTGGTQLGTIFANPNDTIYLSIDSNGNNYYCDNTKIDFQIDLVSAPTTATPTPLNGPTSTELPPNYTPPPSTGTPLPTATPPTPQPTPEPCNCTIDFLFLDELYCALTTELNGKLAVPVQLVQSTQQAVLDVQLFHRVEDEILSQTLEGQHYIDLYYENGNEIIQILYNDPALKQEAIEVLQMWEPNLQALVDGNGSTVTITNAQVLAVQTFLNNLSAQASPELQQVIANEQIQQPLEQFSGVTMAEALVYVEDGLSETPTPTVTPSPTAAPDLIFADGFESGNFSAWDWASTDGGDLSVSTQSAVVGSYGMQAFFDDGHEIIIEDHTPSNEKHFSARYYFDPNSVQVTSKEGFYLFQAASETGWVACVYFEQQGDHYSLSLCGQDDSNAWLETDAILIEDTWQAVEVEWKAATSVGANDGYIKMRIGDQLAASFENLDNDTQFVTETGLGVYPASTLTASGMMYYDAFESRAGSHIGLDSNGPVVSPPPARPDLIFVDGFESGDLSQWNPTLSKVDGGDLSASASAAHQSGYGLKALIDDTIIIKAVDASPANETHYRARFYFNPNSLVMSSGSAHYIFDGFEVFSNDNRFRLELIRESGAYKLRPRVMNDAYSYITGNKQVISNDWHVIEIEWQVSSSPGANNGFLSLWIDGVLAQTLSGVDNDTHRLDQVLLGATAGVDVTTSGSMLFDKFESRRITYIGP